MSHASSSQPVLPAVTADSLRAPLLTALHKGPFAVVVAPPGAGKSSRIPLWLLQAPWRAGKKILLLEPRRVAARALGRYMASLLGEAPGQTVGWRMRDEDLSSPRTQLLVVTEGVLTRMLQADAALEDVACVIFDEFHERSLQADLGLALCLESQAALRPDLRLLIMSATMDAQAVAQLLEAGHQAPCPVLSCAGQAFPVETRWLPLTGTHPRGPALWRHTAAAILQALAQEEGSLLAFLPGTAEIRQVADLLQERLPAHTDLCPLFGTLSAREQDAAIAPSPAGRRKVVLATSIAETSLTIEGIRLVVDAGLARTSRFDPACGLAHLVTERVSLAAAAQRQGRAGRLEPGICYRLWSREEERGMRAQTRPEILEADLSSLVLQLAGWGSPVDSLAWLDTPPAAALAVARQTLYELGALDSDQATARITPLGRRMAALPLSPRLARLLLHGQERGQTALAACLAALLDERDPLYRPAGSGEQSRPPDCQLLRRLDWLCRRQVHTAQGQHERLRRTAQRLAGMPMQSGRPPKTGHSTEQLFTEPLQQQEACGSLLALAWPSWLAMRTDRTTAGTGAAGPDRSQPSSPAGHTASGKAYATFLLCSGRAAQLPADDPLARSAFLAVAAVDGTGPRGSIRLAAPLSLEEVEELFGPRILCSDKAVLSADGSVLARRQRLLGSLVLEERPLPRPEPETCAAALCSFIRQQGLQVLPWTDASRQWRERVRLLYALDGPPWPDLSSEALCASLEDWLWPSLCQCTSLQQLSAEAFFSALRALLPYPLPRRLEQEAPSHWLLPSGNRKSIIYGDAGGPWLEAKLQELFGCEDGPRVAGGRTGVSLRLNSPAGRPLQITQDLAHFWRHGYAAVRAEMRGRYPRHPWPEDPLTAEATALTKKKLDARKKQNSK